MLFDRLYRMPRCGTAAERLRLLRRAGGGALGAPGTAVGEPQQLAALPGGGAGSGAALHTAPSAVGRPALRLLEPCREPQQATTEMGSSPKGLCAMSAMAWLCSRNQEGGEEEPSEARME